MLTEGNMKTNLKHVTITTVEPKTSPPAPKSVSKKSSNGRNRVVELVASVNTETNEIIFHVQSEIEALALEMLGTVEDIHSTDDFEIPIGNNLVIEYEKNKGWVLNSLNSDCI